MTRDALFSPCRTWRYALTRQWNPERDPVVFIGLNPSTADETVDDPTIRRCRGFAHSWGYGGIVMLNLFAFRSTDPRGLRKAPDPVGPDNDDVLRSLTNARVSVCAWGVHGAFASRADRVTLMLLGAGRDLRCLGTTKAGHPRHPLYLRRDTPLAPFVAPRYSDPRH